MRKILLPALLLAVPVLVLYSVNLQGTPLYLHDAEVLFALHAHSIATTAHDTNGRFLPVYFQMVPIGDNVWFQPAIVYLMALFLEVLPFTETAIRLPSVVVGSVNVVLMFFIARRIFASERLGLLAAILLALTPAHFINGRIAMDYLYPVAFVMAWLLCLLILLERKTPWILFAAASFLGFGVYSYIASLIMMPVYLALTCLTLFRTSKNAIRLSLIAVAGFVWPLTFMALWLFDHQGAVVETMGRYRPGPSGELAGKFGGLPLAAVLETLRQSAHFSGITGRISLYWYFFDPAYLFVTGGYANMVNSTRHVGVFLLPLLVFVPVGLVQLARRPTPINVILLAGFVSAPLAACLIVPEPYAIDREMELLPFAVLIATCGLACMLSASRKLWRVAGICLLALVPLHFCFFLFDYFGDYRVRTGFWFEGNHREALETIIAREPQDHPPAIYLNADRLPYIDDYWRMYLIKHGRQDLLDRTVDFSWKTLDVERVPAGSVLLTRVEDAERVAPSGKFRRLATIPEPDTAPNFAILQR
jgi:4-amino-4-deoxy-L-arabinose transferase-like glycosyltransferase